MRETPSDRSDRVILVHFDCIDSSRFNWCLLRKFAQKIEQGSNSIN